MNRLVLGLFIFLSLPIGAVAAEKRESVAPSLEIDRIEVTGISVFSQTDIEESLEVSPGDQLERLKITHTAENLQELYHMHGYEQMTIKSRMMGSVLEFQVYEGKPTRIFGIHFTPDSIRDDSFRKYWKSLEAEIFSRIGLHPGDIFDQEKVSAGKRAVQELLASEEFIGAKVDDVRITGGTVAPLGIPVSPGGTARWVSLDFHVDLGDRVAFGFRGNTVFTQARLDALVDDQRVLGFGKDYIGAIRSRIEDEYRSDGYARVKVTPFTVERPARQERHVTYEISEGPRVALEGIDFDGNSVFSNLELQEQFNAKASLLLQHGYYVEKDVQKAADLVVEWMKSRGYLGAKVVTISTLAAVQPKRAGKTASAVRQVIYLYEGDQTIVRSITLSGLSAFTPEQIKARLGLQESHPLNLFAFSDGLEAVKASYRSRGYLAVRISNEGTENVVKYSDENRTADIEIDFSEGYQFKVSSVQIDGLVMTKDYVVRREMSLKEGDILSENALADSQARLRRLGIFSVVAVRLVDDPNRPDAKAIHISVQEGTPGVLAGGPGFRNDLGFRLFGQVAYTNLWGMNHTLSLTANANHRIEDFRFVEYQGQLAYLFPYFFLDDMTFRPTFTVSGIEYIKFDATTVSAAVTWEKRLFRDPLITGLFTYSLERVNQFNAVAPEDNQQLRIGAVIPAIRLDTRDNPLSPTTGWYAALSYEYSAPWLFSQTDPFPIGYSRVQGRVDRLIPISREITWYLSFRGGFERSNENVVNDVNGVPIAGSGAIPLIKQFALGGAGSLRGFAEQELNVQDKSIRGTASYANYRTQLDLPFAGALRFGPFLDAANLLVDNHSFGQYFFDSVRFGAGFGFHYQTPVGPVNVDIGFKLNRQPGEDPSRFYFSIGLI